MAAIGPSNSSPEQQEFSPSSLCQEKQELLSIIQDLSRRTFSFHARDWGTCSLVIQNLSLVLIAREMKEQELLEEKLSTHQQYAIFKNQLQQAYKDLKKPLNVDTQILFQGWLSSFNLQITVPSFDCEKLTLLPGNYRRDSAY